MTGTELVIIAGMLLVTYTIRSILLLFSHKIRLSSGVERALTYVPPAVLTAITVPAVLMPRGPVDISLANHYLLSAAAAVTAGIIFRRIALWAAIVTGLTVFVLWKIFYPLA